MRKLVSLFFWSSVSIYFSIKDTCYILVNIPTSTKQYLRLSEVETWWICRNWKLARRCWNCFWRKSSKCSIAILACWKVKNCFWAYSLNLLENTSTGLLMRVVCAIAVLVKLLGSKKVFEIWKAAQSLSMANNDYVLVKLELLLIYALNDWSFCDAPVLGLFWMVWMCSASMTIGSCQHKLLFFSSY